MSTWRIFCRTFSSARSERSYIDKMFIAALPLSTLFSLCKPVVPNLRKQIESPTFWTKKRIAYHRTVSQAELCHKMLWYVTAKFRFRPESAFEVNLWLIILLLL